MSNGVEVIVRGRKTALIGFDKTPWLPHRVNPSRPVTLPAHTVSRQFHLVEKPGKPYHHAVGHLLQSIVRSAIPDMVTKTMVTTFTYMTTVLKNSNTIVKSREEIISNVMTQKFRPTMEYTPSLKSEPSTLAPELLASFVGASSSYLTNTLTTTYIYYNTFTAGGLPVVLTSRETVSNVLTLPAYLSPTLVQMNQLSSTRVFETETYYSTYTFSKTMINPTETVSPKVVTTKETVTQVVVTEALLPLRSQEPPLLTPLPPSYDEITKTYFTTFTHLFTEVGKNGQLTIRSSTRIASETVTETLTDRIDRTKGPHLTSRLKTPVIVNNILLTSPAFDELTTTIRQTKTLTPVLLYATKVYYTTYTYFTTVRNKGATGKPPKVHSRTQVVSRVVTEALSTAFDVHYVAQLKSSYLAKHSVLLDITSSVKEIIPTRTIDFTERPGTLVTQQVFHPHWPKDDDQLAFEVEGTTTTAPTREPIKNFINLRHPSISSSEEHFDEVKEGVHKIVSVLTNTKVTKEADSYLKPTKTYDYLYSTATLVDLESSLVYPPSAMPDPDPYIEQATLTVVDDIPDFDESVPEATTEMDTIIMERPISHIPTPPLRTRYTTKPTASKTKKPIFEDKTNLDQFPEIGPSPTPSKSVIVDYPSDIMDYSDDIFDDTSSRFGFVNSGFQASSTILGKRTGTVYFDQVSSFFKPVGGIDPSAQFAHLMSDMAPVEEDAYEDIKDNSEEEIEPPTIYNIPAAFDSNAIVAFNKHQFQLSKLNKTQVTIKKKTPEPEVKITSTTTTTAPTPEEEIDDVTLVSEDVVEKQDEPEDDKQVDENTENENKEEQAEDDVDDNTGNDNTEDVPEETNTENEEPNETGIKIEVADKSTNDTDDQVVTDAPVELAEEVVEKDSTLDKELEDLLEKTFAAPSSTTYKPKKQKNRYTTRQRPKGSRRPATFRPAPFSEEDSAESSTNVYALKPVRFSEDSEESLSEEDPDLNDDKNHKKDSEQDDNSSESYERRPSGAFHGGPSGPSGPSGPGATGPSKSSLAFPIAGAGTAAIAATSGINWKPLLNLGAIGLGGLGASSLTKLGPLFNSVAGYMKGALLPIARNDTQHTYSKKSQRGNKRPSYSRQPPKEASIIQHSEPNYIPVGNGNNHVNSQNYRFSDERIPRRPVVTHANEPNFRPIATDRDPDLIAGPLPPPIHFNVNPHDQNFPPNHNYNFKPPNDHLPNIYTLTNDDVHKHGDPHPQPSEYDNRHDSSANKGQRPSDSNPEGKTEFVLRPLHNLMNGRPMFDNPPAEGPPPQRNPGKIISVPRPAVNRDPPKRPVYRPRPGPASIEMINEIKDSQRQPFDRPNPTIILPHRKPQNQNNPQQNRPPFSNGHRPPPPPPTSIVRPPFLNLPGPHPEDIGNRVPWGMNDDERFDENPFKEGNNGPPKLMDNLADSKDSFESHFSHGAQKPFFNQPGFITHDHFNDLLSTPSPTKRFPNFPPGNMNNKNPDNRPSAFDGPSPTFDHPVRAQEIPFHPEGETQASEESIYHPQRPANDNGNNKYNGPNKMQRPPGQNSNELILHPHNGQNVRPFRPIQGSHEDFESQRVRDQTPFKNSHNSAERPEPRPQNIFRDHQQRLPPPGRNPPNQGNGHHHDDEFGNHHDSAEDLFHFQQSMHSRPPGAPPPGIPPWAFDGPNSGGFPGPMNPPNGNQERFPGPMDRPNNNQERFPGPMNQNGHPNDRFRGPPSFGNGDSNRFPGPMNQPSPPQPLPVPPLERPTQHFPPYQQNPSTVYIVEEPDHNHDEHLQEHDSEEHPNENNHNYMAQTTPEPYPASNERNTQFPKLIIKEVPTRPVVPFERRTTTPLTVSTTQDESSYNPTTNRAMISKLFIRRFKSTTTPGPITVKTTTEGPRTSQSASSSNSRTAPPWLSKSRSTTRRSTTTTAAPPSKSIDTFDLSPTMNDLMNFEQKFKQKYGTRRPNNPSNRFDGKINITDKSFENADTDEYSDEIDELKSSSNITFTEHHDHPNHHPVHNPPIDVTKYLTDVDEDEFGQLYQGTEDQDTIIDPVNQEIIKSPFESRRNVSNFMRRSTTTAPEPPTTNPSPATLSSSEENTFIDRFTVPEGIFASTPSPKSNLWGPTTFRPKNNDLFQEKISRHEPAPIPTTYRGDDDMRPTTYRPGSVFNPMKDLNNIFPSNMKNNIPSLRPAPQAGMASFYDDEDSMDQIKIKNSEIHKIPPFMGIKRPGGIALVKPEDLEEYESSQEKLRDKLNKASESHKIKEYLDAYDSGEGSKESPSGFPSTKLKPPLPRPAPPKPPSQSQRPGPIETLTNFFRKPPVRNFPTDQKFQNQPGPSQGVNNNGQPQRVNNNNNGPPQGVNNNGPPQRVNNNEGPPHRVNNNNGPPPLPQRKPFLPQRPPVQPVPQQKPSNIQIVRPQPPTTTPRPLKLKVEYTPHNFANTQIKTIPLNPNIKVPQKTTQDKNEDDANGGEVKDEANLISDDNKKIGSNQNVKVEDPDSALDTTGNGHRESSYMYDSEYYEDDDESTDAKNDVIPPIQNQNRPQPSTNTQSPNSKPNQGPTNRPLPPGNNNRVAPNQNRPQLMRPLNVGGHLVNGNNRTPLFQNNQRPPPRPNQPNPRPPGFSIFDSTAGSRPFQPNSPSTEMEPPPIDSNRLKPPVLELPSSGPIRYRPNGEPSGGSNINRPNLLRPDDEFFKPPDRRPSPSVHTIASVDENNKIVGTNTFTAILPSKSGDIEVIPTETLQQAGNISPTEVHLEGSEVSVIIPSHSSGVNLKMSSVIKYTGGRLENSAVEERVNSSITKIEPTKSSATRPFIQRTRGPTISSTFSPPVELSSPVSVNSTSRNSTNNRFNILNRRPIQTIRSSTTSKISSSTSSEGPITSTVKSIVRRPFIPTRGPGPNIVPWARRTQSTTEKSVVSSTNPSTISKFSPSATNRNRTVTRFDTNRRPTSTSANLGPSLKTDESKSSERNVNSLNPTTFRPSFKRPGSFEESSEETVTTVSSRFVPAKRLTPKPSTTTTTTRQSVFRNVTSQVSANPSNGDSEYEEYSDEYEDEEGTQKPGPSSSDEGNNAREVSTSGPSQQNRTVTTVTAQVTSEINPTRTNPRGGTRFRNTLNSGRPGRPGSGSSETKPEAETTRYVTHTDSQTVTVTETETSVFSSRGSHRTQTVIITKTQPPQTLISTIVGTVTLVNTVDVKPTTVRTTIFSEPTKAVYTFVDTSESSRDRDRGYEESTEKVSLGGIITAGNRPRPKGTLQNPEPSPAEPGGNILRKPFSIDSSCQTNCSLSSNQACRTFANGTRIKCDCKPGYARMKPKYPCRPTFTYEMSIGINHMDGMSFDFKDLYNAATDGYLNFITVTKEAIDKAFLATDIKRQFLGTEIIGLHPVNYMNDKTLFSEPKVDVDFLVQLTTNITEDRIKNHLIRTLKAANFSVGRTGISSTRNMSDFSARDFNECLHKEFQDCSPNAECLNVRGSFTCKCNAGYKDKSSKRKPGRDCHETSGCKECNFHGTCHTDTHGNPACHCFKWYGGIECQINLKFLLIAITGIGSVLFLLVLLCGSLVCKRSKIARGERVGSGRFMRYRSPTTHSQATLERTAIMNDSASSDGRQSPHPITHSFTPDSLLIDVDPKGPPGPGPGPRHHPGLIMGGHVQQQHDVNLMNFSLRNVADRSLNVVIPRAKIRPPSRPSSRHAAIGPDTNAELGTTERKLISYLDQNPYAQAKPTPSRQSTIRRNDSKFRKFSLQEQRKISQGALVSSGIEVSAMGGMRRKSTTGLEPDLPYGGYEKSISEVRSFGETIRSPAKQQLYTTDTSRTSRASCYSCKPPSYCGAYSESHGHTMGDKDGASTVYTTQGKLFRMAHDGHDDDTCSTASSQ